MKDIPGTQGTGAHETVPLGHAGDLLYKATQSRLGDIADIPSTKKKNT